MATKLVRKQRRVEAEERQKHWNALTPAAKLKSLDARPGESKKERARIILAMAADVRTAAKKATV